MTDKMTDKMPKQLKKKKSDRLKRKSSERKTSERKTSERKTSERKTSVKKTWEKFVQESDSRTLLKNAWKVDNSQKEYSDKINKLRKKYNSNNI